MSKIVPSKDSLQGVTDISVQRALELDITYLCNMSCIQCNRALGILPSTQRMTVEQIEKVLNESRMLTKPFHKIRILGGEPTLHPQIADIVTILESYYTQVECSEISIWTNGASKMARYVLPKLPSWIHVHVSPKKDRFGGDSFEPFLVAPVDYLDYHTNDFSIGCAQIAPGKCGVGVTPNGVYVCPVAAAIDRVIGLDVGINNLIDVSNNRFRQQCEKLCRFCGHFLVDRGMEFGIETISSTWKKIVDEHKVNEQKLSKY